MGRPHIEAIHYLELDEADAGEGPLRGARLRILSADDEDGSYSAVVSLPAGFQSDDPSPGRPCEIFVLEGELGLGGTSVATGSYAYTPSTAADKTLVAPEGCTALLMVEVERVDTGEVEVVDPTDRPWKVLTAAAGEAVKLLHEDKEVRNTAALVSLAPGTGEWRTEVHEGNDELFVIRGDILIGRPGIGDPVIARAGSYSWRPPFVRHLPKFSHSGAMCFIRTRDGDYDIGVEWGELDYWPDAISNYVRDQGPYFEPVRA